MTHRVLVPRLGRRRGAAALGVALVAAVTASTTVPAGRAVAAPEAPAPVAPAVATAPVPHLHWATCGGGFQCARAQVPLDYDAPRRASISLALIRLPATSPARRIGSLFVNPGGPGGSGVDFVRQAGKFVYGPLIRARFDIVGFDPRGVASSSPLRCYPSNAAENAVIGGLPPFPVGRRQIVHFISAYQRFAAACLQRDATIMQHMSTADVARDLDLLRQGVGDPGLSYDGVSYGSYLGNTYANLFPTKVRALVIDGVLNPVQWATGTGDGYRVPFSTRIKSAQGAYVTLQQFFALCSRGGSACAFSAGNPRAKYTTLLARARAHPIVVRTPGGPVKISYADIVAVTLGALYSPYSFPALAQILQQLYRASGGAAVTLETADLALARPAYENEAEAFLGVSCTDTNNPHNPFAWPAAARAQDRQYPPFGSVWTYASEPCSTWPARAADRYTGPFTARTANPVLVVGNSYDPATPYQGAQVAAGLLGNARLLTLRGWGHTSIGKSTCIDGYVTAYLLRRALPPAGTVCAPDYVPFRSPLPSAARSAAAAAVTSSLLPAQRPSFG